MTRKFKLLILSLLGFSAACSGVKNNAKSQPADEPDAVRDVRPDIRVMYGVRRPVPVGKADTIQVVNPDESEARSAAELKEQQARENYPVVTMYGVRVPMENIDLDSLKRVQQERQQAPQTAEPDKE